MQPLPLLPREKLFTQVKGLDEKIEKKMQRFNRFKDDFANQTKKITIPGISLDGKCSLIMI
jgi:hypothetical protein